MLPVVTSPKIHAPPKIIQPALCLPNPGDILAAVRSETHVPNRALNVAGLEHETEHIDCGVRGLQLRPAHLNSFGGSVARRSIGIGLRLHPLFPGCIERFRGSTAPHFRLGQLAFQCALLGFKLGRDLLHIGPGEHRPGIGNHELSLKQFKANPAAGEPFLPDLAFEVERRHRRRGRLAPQAFHFCTPCEFSDGF